ncbi:MAG: RES family NAD+ phosphorylase [Gemmataceae bacterium]|nr:RES family NAD+ phosphorylase [Gemmataceae bacterium]
MTVRVWRIDQVRWAATSFSGEGARLYGGRWNSPGRSVVYVAEHPGLAALEVLVHAIPERRLRTGYCLIEAIVPPELIDPIPDLPDDWAADPPPETARAVGDRWLAADDSRPALRIPSAVVPDGFNYLLNPLHPRFAEVRIGQPQPFRFDPRLG